MSVIVPPFAEVFDGFFGLILVGLGGLSGLCGAGQEQADGSVAGGVGNKATRIGERTQATGRTLHPMLMI